MADADHKIIKDPASKHLYTFTSTKLILAVIFLGLLLMLLASMASILSNTKFGKFERLITNIEEDLEKTSNLLLDNVFHKNEYQRKVSSAKKRLIDAGHLNYEIAKPDLTKDFDIDANVLNKFNQEVDTQNPGNHNYDILVSLYMTNYEIDSYDADHSLVVTYDRQTKKVNLKGTNLKSSKGYIYYLIIGKKATAGKPKRRLELKNTINKRRLKQKSRRANSRNAKAA